MLKDIDEVKAFIEWAAKMGLSRAKVGDIEFEINPLKLANDMYEQGTQTPEIEPETVPESSTDAEFGLPTDPTKMSKEEEELLFHSSGS